VFKKNPEGALMSVFCICCVLCW